MRRATSTPASRRLPSCGRSASTTRPSRFISFPTKSCAPFRFDWFKVQHIISNLLDNAMKYTPACGTVWLHVEPYFWERRAAKSKPSLDRRRAVNRIPNCCRISVADTGPGIAPEFQQEIFEEYFRLTAQGDPSRGLRAGPGHRAQAGAGRRRKDLGRERARPWQQVFFSAVAESCARTQVRGSNERGPHPDGGRRAQHAAVSADRRWSWIPTG